MAAREEFPLIFKKLKAILVPYAAELVVVHDTDTHYYLDTKHVMPRNKLPLFFASVRIRKSYVSFYLMPVYACPDLLLTISPALKKRVQGKSCFNFKSADEELFAELAQLTKAGFKKFTDVAVLKRMVKP
jgi:hypothetical protein